MTPGVSILVPVYNVSAYIERCAHSIFQQTFQDIEYVFVNDGSTDNSIDVLKSVIEHYPARKPHIKIIEFAQNQGLAVARNTLIEHSTGKYILSVDSDDYIDVEMVETLYNKIEDEQADIAVCDLVNEYSDGTSRFMLDYVPENQEDYFFEMLKNDRSQSYRVTKLVRRDLYEKADYHIPSGLNYLEDRYLMPRLYYYATKIVKVNQPFYHYIHYNAASITKNKGQMHFENSLLFWQSMDEFLKEKDLYNQYKEVVEQSKVANKVHLMVDVRSYKLRKEYATMFRDIEMKYIHRFRRGERLMLWLVHYRLFAAAQLCHQLLRWKNLRLK
ncbi:beta-1,3-glucosyltransferase [Candidatus Symbiothrix dinenymphae]|nr:beta-1,3-glucosyltransferase [Candidatus Symbiothrix dinenymphae]